MTPDPKPLKDYILKHIIKNVSDIENSSPLFSSGLIDSFGMLDLIFFIEQQYKVQVQDFEIIDSKADTLDDIMALIAQKS